MTGGRRDREASVFVPHSGTTVHLHDAPHCRATFGRGSETRPVDIVLADVPTLSRVSVELRLEAEGVRVVRHQGQGAAVEILATGGHVAAALLPKSDLLCRDLAFRIRIRVEGGSFVLEVRQTLTANPLRDSSSTVATSNPWRTAVVLEFVPGQEWRRVLALACARTAYPRGVASPRGHGDVEAHVPTFKWLRTTCNRLSSAPVSQRWVSDRLDEALEAMGEPRDGKDKLMRLVPLVLRNNWLSPDTLHSLATQIEG